MSGAAAFFEAVLGAEREGPEPSGEGRSRYDRPGRVNRLPLGCWGCPAPQQPREERGAAPRLSRLEKASSRLRAGPGKVSSPPPPPSPLGAHLPP